ncbi:MAG: cobalamin B12-binding domain-containing protein [Thermodesulfobacteriota bacterium]
MAAATTKTLKLLIAKAGLDGHDRGVKIVARALQEAGFEIVYTGVHHTPEMIVETAVKEKIDAIGISILSGAHLHIFTEVFKLLKQNDSDNIPVFGGGVVPQEDLDKLKDIGVKTVFLPGTPLEEIVGWINKNVQPREIQ